MSVIRMSRANFKQDRLNPITATQLNIDIGDNFYAQYDNAKWCSFIISALITCVATMLRLLERSALSGSLPSEIGLLTALSFLYCCNLLLVLRWILGLCGYMLGISRLFWVIRVIRVIRFVIWFLRLLALLGIF
jgi:hypothetical protein